MLHPRPAICLVLLTIAAASQTRSAEIGALPGPTGPFAIGRVTVHWIDQSRIEPLSPNHAGRELMVDIWYPADPSAGILASYLNVPVFEQALGAVGFQKQFGDASGVIQRGVPTHAVVNAPFVGSTKGSAKPAPLLIFSPGGSMVPQVYTAQLEDLASHGYVVAAISHTYDAIVTVFPGGRYVVYDSKRWPAIPSVEGEANLNQLEWHAADIRFVLNQLSRANEAASSALPFATHLDLARVGAFGHSFGGIAAAHACQIDPRFKVCLNQDGLVGMRPFDARGWGMDQAFMLIERTPPKGPPPEQALAAMNMTLERAESLLARFNAYHDLILRSTGKGSYCVLIKREGTSHDDFTDLPILGARDSAGEETRARVLAMVRSYTLAFFDKHVRGMSAPLLDSNNEKSEFVEAIQKFAPAKPPCSSR